MSAFKDLYDGAVNDLNLEYLEKFNDLEMSNRSLEGFVDTYQLDVSTTPHPFPVMRRIKCKIPRNVVSVEKIDDYTALLLTGTDLQFILDLHTMDVKVLTVPGAITFQGKSVVFNSPSYEESDDTIYLTEKTPEHFVHIMRYRDNTVHVFEDPTENQDGRIYLQQEKVDVKETSVFVYRDAETQKHEWCSLDSDIIFRLRYRGQWYTYNDSDESVYNQDDNGDLTVDIGEESFIVHCSSQQKYPAPWGNDGDMARVVGEHIFVYCCGNGKWSIYYPVEDQL